ncbi:MAG: type II toxin-antitoxin system RelE/ParE family toxin [Deltaproteobacteria bacterium CG_4_8_14_3_um_filter_45_9]|jgi:plasmid stabilization system protein ParE|nr:MAG: type II toxin-antitoxin system RelE/ParE family toxin [Deltaproteobacteria bacterium CG_4_8_14_3_um_filter_45_9]
MALKIKWSPRAASNLEEICNYITKDSEYYSILFAKKITNIVKAIPQFPKSGRVVPEYRDENLREKIYKNYRIVYRLKEEFIEIVAICHGAKPLDDLI